MINKLLAYLTENGIGHNFFARKVGSSPATMNRILNNNHMPNLKLAIEIEKATNRYVRVYDWILSKNIDANPIKKNQKKSKKKIYE